MSENENNKSKKSRTRPTKGKMISFRLSEQEYERFREICDAFGGRTMSEMARALLREWIQDGTTDPLVLDARVRTLENRMAELHRTVDMLELNARTSVDPKQASTSATPAPVNIHQFG